MLVVLTGDDEQAILERKAELLKDVSYEVIDCSETPEALLDAMRSPGLFSPKRYVWATSFEALSDPQIVDLTRAVRGSTTLIVARAATITPRSRAHIKAAGEIVTFTQPKGKMVGTRVAELIKNSGLRLDPQAKKLLTERTGHDLDRLNSVLAQCKIADIKAPTREQLEVLVGTSAAPGVPWELSDAIESAEPIRALSAPEVNPMAAAAYLANRYTTLAQIAEAQDDKERIEEVLSSVQKFQAQKLSRLAKQIGVKGSRKVLSLLAEFDTKYKTGANPEAEFDLLLMDLCDIFDNRTA